MPSTAYANAAYEPHLPMSSTSDTPHIASPNNCLPSSNLLCHCFTTKHYQEEIRKIIVQKIPHLSDGRLLFEPDEDLEIHTGTVGMLKGNKNVSVMTTYADVDAIASKT